MSNLPSNDFRVSSTFQKRLIYLLRGDTRKNTEIAKDMSISKDILIRAINAGVIPTTKILIKIADYLDTSSEIFVKLEPPTTFQIRIIELKEQNSVSYFEIASSLGFSRSLFTSWKKFDYIPSLEILYIISRYFNVSIDYLLGRTDDRN